MKEKCWMLLGVVHGHWFEIATSTSALKAHEVLSAKDVGVYFQTGGKRGPSSKKKKKITEGCPLSVHMSVGSSSNSAAFKRINQYM